MMLLPLILKSSKYQTEILGVLSDLCKPGVSAADALFLDQQIVGVVVANCRAEVTLSATGFGVARQTAHNLLECIAWLVRLVTLTLNS